MFIDPSHTQTKESIQSLGDGRVSFKSFVKHITIIFNFKNPILKPLLIARFLSFFYNSSNILNSVVSTVHWCHHIFMFLIPTISSLASFSAYGKSLQLLDEIYHWFSMFSCFICLVKLQRGCILLFPACLHRCGEKWLEKSILLC